MGLGLGLELAALIPPPRAVRPPALVAVIRVDVYSEHLGDAGRGGDVIGSR